MPTNRIRTKKILKMMIIVISKLKELYLLMMKQTYYGYSK
jgi:hypothetical protein